LASRILEEKNHVLGLESPGLGLGLGLESPGLCLDLGLATLVLTTSLVLIEGRGSYYELELMKFQYNTRKSINLQTLL
jgi:hypothetical protein